MAPRKKTPGPSARDQELRRVLVATAELGEPARPRRLALVLGAAGLLIAGGLIGGGVTAAASTAGDPVDTAEGLRVIDSITRANTEFLGEVFHYEGASDATLDVGEPPAGATGLALGTGCVGPTTAEIRVDGEFNTSWECDSGVGGGVSAPATPGPHSLQIEVSKGTAVVWAMWVKEPPHPEASAAQQAALADGVVTRDEYLAGLDRYVGCMGALGHPLTDPSRETLVVQLAIPDAAVQDGSDELCYESEWMQLDMAWQLSQEAGQTVTP